VHQFVSDLERKDQLTRDHVVRTGELAIRVGERMHLKTRELRDLGLAAMLHDIGKLRTPDDILKKPSSLSAEEYDVIKLHPVHGAEMLAAEPTLSSCAPIVRSHHERMDGAGYPDGLVGPAIPLASRIIAVCDSIDAMTHDRQYRKAMPISMAFAILREHAGSQWDQDVVRHVMATLPTMPSAATFDRVGRATPTVGFDSPTDASDVEIPDDLGAILAAVDAEI
jgi:putative nucleotidyltransferase with HDIG domain